jgi:hypothetical protein
MNFLTRVCGPIGKPNLPQFFIIKKSKSFENFPRDGVFCLRKNRYFLIFFLNYSKIAEIFGEILASLT